MDTKKLIESLEKITGKKVVLRESVEDELERLHDEMVPGSGPAETVEGEMVRAINRIWYRYNNDGDFYFKGYGKETCASSVKFLITSPIGKQVRTIFTKMAADSRMRMKTSRSRDGYYDQYKPSDPYLIGLQQIGKIIVDYVNAKQGEHTPANSDSRAINESRRFGSPILPCGNINFKTGKNRYFNVYENGEATFEFWQKQPQGPTVIVSTSGSTPSNKIGDVKSFVHDQSGRDLFTGKMIGFVSVDKAQQYAMDNNLQSMPFFVYK